MENRRKTISVSYLILLFIAGTFFFQSCTQKVKTTEKGVSVVSIDSTRLAPFFEAYPELKKYNKEYSKLYDHYDFHYIWFNEKGIADYGNSLYDRVKSLDEEGVFKTFPYQDEIDEIQEEEFKNLEEHSDEELLMTGLYAFYMDHVYRGIDSTVTKDLGWLLPREDLDDTALLDSVIADNDWDQNDSLMVEQYFKMRDKLKEYRKIQDAGGWEKIEVSSAKKTFEPNDSSEVIRQIRDRLYATGELKKNNESAIYDDELKEGIVQFQKTHGFNRDSVISKEHIQALNVPVKEYIKTIVVNMERLRWIPTKINQVNEFIFVNVPAFHLDYYRNGKVIFDSDVVVGGVMNKTVVFDGEMSYLAFSPYWNLPKSIIEKEVKPGMEKDDDYLEKRNMEWNNGQVRQLPGGNNSLGLVKFMFPNSNDIYLHDTPAKSLFDAEDRARSHGCIRVEKARDLAITILDNDKEWNPEKVDSAMNAGKESIYNLKNKIPVYIGYFTAWVNDDGALHLYKDVYKRDEKLEELVFHK